MVPILIGSIQTGSGEGGERIVSIASEGNVAAFVTTNSEVIQFVDLPSADAVVVQDNCINEGGLTLTSNGSPSAIQISSWWEGGTIVAFCTLLLLSTY